MFRRSGLYAMALIAIALTSALVGAQSAPRYKSDTVRVYKSPT